MAKGLVSQRYLTDIANAIRSKTGEARTYKPSQMAQAIMRIPSNTVVAGESASVDGQTLILSGITIQVGDNAIVEDQTLIVSSTNL